MSKGHRHQHKQGHLGPAFHAYLEWLEYVESVLVSGKQPSRRKYMAMNDRLFHVENEKMMNSIMNETLPVDAWLARVVRSSVKYKMDFKTVLDISERYRDEINYIRTNYQMRLPHEWCTVIIEGIGPDDFIIVGQEQISEVEYDSLGIGAGDQFLCANIAFYRGHGIEVLPGVHEGIQDGGLAPAQKLSYCPVELHMRTDMEAVNNTFLHAVAEGVEVMGPGKTAIDLVRECFLIWMNQFHLQSILRSKTAGVAAAPGKGYQRRRLRKKHQHPQFEHTIIQLEVDAPEPSQTGRSVFQPRKRLHQVRGFWRQLRSGRRVWVKPHWRGDEHLGVIRRDVELITHDERVSHEAQNAS